jgi:hydroxymethylbilane synthase
VRLRIGTRRSRLALAQANDVAGMLGLFDHEVEIVPMSTAGDRGAPVEDSPAGVKGLFVGDITDALLRGEVDLAVHSAKDLPVEDPEGVVVAAVPARADPRDLIVTRAGELPPGAVVGTSSLRRQAQLRRSRPGITVIDLRGNVDTRLRKLEEGACDALVLAIAGLSRLGLHPEHREELEVDEMVPAPGQGALAVQAREGEEATAAVRVLNHPSSRAVFETERRLVSLVGGGCRLPLGAHAYLDGSGIRLIAVVIRVDGSGMLRAEATGATPDETAGAVAEELLAAGAADILREAT